MPGFIILLSGPLTVMTGDQSAVLYAYGQPDTDTVYINMGTGVFIQRPSADQKIDIPDLLRLQPE